MSPLYDHFFRGRVNISLRHWKTTAETDFFADFRDLLTNARLQASEHRFRGGTFFDAFPFRIFLMRQNHQFFDQFLLDFRFDVRFFEDSCSFFKSIVRCCYILIMISLENGISNFSAQNMGAGYAIRVRQGYHAGLKMVWLFSIPLTILYFFGGQFLFRLFLESATATAYETGILSSFPAL